MSITKLFEYDLKAAAYRTQYVEGELFGGVSGGVGGDALVGPHVEQLGVDYLQLPTVVQDPTAEEGQVSVRKLGTRTAQQELMRIFPQRGINPIRVCVALG